MSFFNFFTKNFLQRQQNGSSFAKIQNNQSIDLN